MRKLLKERGQRGKGEMMSMRRLLAVGLLGGLPMVVSSQANATWWDRGYYDHPADRYRYSEPRAYGYYYDGPRVRRHYYGPEPRLHWPYHERDCRYCQYLEWADGSNCHGPSAPCRRAAPG